MKRVKIKLPTKYGEFDFNVFCVNDEEIPVLTYGEIKDNTLLRVHSSCITGDIFRSCKCDCGEQLTEALNLIKKNGSGILIYLNQEGRGIGLYNKICAYKLQEKGLDTFEANRKLGYPDDLRTYEKVEIILKELEISSVRILTNNPIKADKINIEKTIVPLVIPPNGHNKSYILTKRKYFSGGFN